MRKVVQIAVEARSGSWLFTVYALCDDGTIWRFDNSADKWWRVPNIPQDAPTLAAEGGGDVLGVNDGDGATKPAGGA